MQCDLSTLEMPLTRVKSCAEQAFDGEIDWSWRVEIDSEVDDTVGSLTKDGKKLESTIIERVSDEGRSTSSKSVGRHLDLIDRVLLCGTG